MAWNGSHITKSIILPRFNTSYFITTFPNFNTFNQSTHWESWKAIDQHIELVEWESINILCKFISSRSTHWGKFISSRSTHWGKFNSNQPTHCQSSTSIDQHCMGQFNTNWSAHQPIISSRGENDQHINQSFHQGEKTHLKH